MKFALTELKLALIKVMQSFEVHCGPNTPDQIEFIEGFVRSPKQPIKIIFKKRTN